jgi:hypothetical protein
MPAPLSEGKQLRYVYGGSLKVFQVRSLLFHLCGLVVRVPSYRPRGPGFSFLRFQIFGETAGL